MKSKGRKRDSTLNSAPRKITYAMTLMGTEASTGFFACLPDSEPDLQQTLSYLAQHPLDTFMHRYALSLIGRLTSEQVQALRDQTHPDDPVGAALLQEAALKFTLNYLARPGLGGPRKSSQLESALGGQP